MASVVDPFDQSRIPLKPLPYVNKDNAHTDELIVDYGTPNSKYHIYIADSIDPSHLIDITNLIIEEMIHDASINANDFEINIDGLNNEGDTIPFKLKEILNRIYKQYIFPDNQEGFDYERDADKAFDGTGKVILLTDEHGNVLFPVTTADAIYDASGVSIQERLDNMTRFAMTVRYIYATNQDQTSFEFDYPFKNYPDGGNFMEVRIGTTYFDKSRYAILDTKDNNNDITGGTLTFIQGDKLEYGRRIDLLFIYNTPSLSSATTASVDGSIFISNSIPLSKMEKFTSNYLVNDPSSIATSSALYNLYMDIVSMVAESNNHNFWFRDPYDYQISPRCVIEERPIHEGDLFHIVFAKPKSKSIGIMTTGAIVDGVPAVQKYPIRLATDQDLPSINSDTESSAEYDYVANKTYKFLFRNNTFYCLNPITENALLRSNTLLVELIDQQVDVSYEGLYGISEIQEFVGDNQSNNIRSIRNNLFVYRNNNRLFPGVDYTFNNDESSIHLFVRGEEHDRIMFEIITAENINGEIVVEYEDPREKADIDRDGIIYEPGTDRVIVLPGSKSYTVVRSPIPPNVNNDDNDQDYDYYDILSATLDFSHPEVYDVDNDVIMIKDDFDTSEIYNAVYAWLDENPDANIFVGPWNVIPDNKYVISVNGKYGEVNLSPSDFDSVSITEFNSHISNISNRLSGAEMEIGAHHLSISELQDEFSEGIGKIIDNVDDDVIWSGEGYINNTTLYLLATLNEEYYDFIDIYYRSIVCNEYKIATIVTDEENRTKKKLWFDNINNGIFDRYEVEISYENTKSIYINSALKWSWDGDASHSANIVTELSKNEFCIYKICGRYKKTTLAEKKVTVNNIDDVSTTSEIKIKCLGILGNINEYAAQSINTYDNKLYIYSGNTGRFFVVNPYPSDNIVDMDSYSISPAIDKGNGFACDGTYFYLNATGCKLYRLLPNESSIDKEFKFVDNTLKMHGLAYGTIDNDVGDKLYCYSAYTDYITIYEVALNTTTLKAYTTEVCTIYNDRALRMAQDMEIFNGEVYLCGDYPSKVVRIAFNRNEDGSLSGYIKRVYSANKYCDNGFLLGEVEGLVNYNGELISISGFTNCVPSELKLDFAQIGSDLGFKRKRTMIIGVFDPSQSYIEYNRELRGATAFQDIERYVNNDKDLWLPDGGAGRPFPSVVLATNVKNNPSRSYIYRIVNPETDSNGDPQVLLFDQHNSTFILEAQTKTIKVYIYKCTNINIHAKSNFVIQYLVDSTINYMSDSSFCLGVAIYNAGYTRFNAKYTMGNAFGRFSAETPSCPNGDYAYIHRGDTYMPPRKIFNVQAKANGKTYYGNGISTNTTFRIPVCNTVGNIATGVFKYDSTTKMCYLSSILMQDGTEYTESDLSDLVINVKMN